MRLFLALVTGLTLAFGLCVAASFYLVGGRVAVLGPHVIERSWPIIYPLQAVLVGAVMLMVIRGLRSRLDTVGIGVAVIGAWIGQWLVLASGILADELNPLNAVYFWILATGGPTQPIAASAGAWLGLRRARSRATT